jgi:calcium/calmodulin-dependent protein kinase I
MTTLVGAFVSKEKEEYYTFNKGDSSSIVYPFRVNSTKGEGKIFYCKTKEIRGKWMNNLAQAME